MSEVPLQPPNRNVRSHSIHSLQLSPRADNSDVPITFLVMARVRQNGESSLTSLVTSNQPFNPHTQAHVPRRVPEKRVRKRAECPRVGVSRVHHERSTNNRHVVTFCVGVLGNAFCNVVWIL